MFNVENHQYNMKTCRVFQNFLQFMTSDDLTLRAVQGAGFMVDTENSPTSRILPKL